MNTTQTVAQYDLLDIAGNMLAYHDTRDRLKPGLLELTGVSQHGMATLSGLNDYDYQNLQTLSMGHKQLSQIRTVNRAAIPSEILEHFKHIKCHCTMGLFPEIGRAWLTIDSEIYIWTYEQSRDVAYYDGLNHLIVSVGLVRPKPDVFVNDVKYLLVLTTPIEIVVLGVTFGDSAKTINSATMPNSQNTSVYEEMQLMNKPIFVLSTDNISINVVQGSADGRIFLGGRDGCLYEIYYQAESSWFGKRCKKVNHSQGIVSYIMPNFLKVFSETDPIERIAIDNSRNLLYVLTEKGAIEAWYMGADYSEMRRLGKITQNEIIYSATSIVKTVDPSVFKSVKAICPLTRDDCENMHLLAITQCGVRLYFSTIALNMAQYHQQQHRAQTNRYAATAQHQQQQLHGQEFTPEQTTQYPAHTPNGLYMLHVRIPPGYTPNTTTNKPKQVHAAYYGDNTLLLVTTPQQDQDLLWSVSSSPFQNTHYLVESTAVEPLDGIVWSLAEVRDRTSAKHPSLLYSARTPKKMAMLTNQGTHIMSLLKPMDLLHQLLVACKGPHHEAVKAFFQAQTEKEACTTCLLIATAEEFRSSEVAHWAAQAFMLYGGEPVFQHQIHQVQNINQPAPQQPQTTSNRALLNTSVLNNTNVSGGQGSVPSPQQQPHMFISTPLPHPTDGSAGGSPTHNRSHTPNVTLQQSQFPLSPISQQQSNTYFPQMAPSTHEQLPIVYSAKHDGLYLYVVRMMRPIWQMPCVTKQLCSRLTYDDCKLLLNDLCALRAFLDAYSVHDISSTVRNTTFNNQTGRSNGYNTMILSNNNLPMNQERNAIEQAHAEEKRSLTALNHFVKHACEVIELWYILTDHQFELIATQLTPEQQNQLQSATFRELILSRTEVCAFLIIALINSYLKDNASVNAISTKLRHGCPNLYRYEDAITYQATEIMMNAKNCNTPKDRLQKLRIAMQMCKEAAPMLPLHNICQQFINAQFYEGVVELAATCASKSDPEELGIHYYTNDEPTEDREGYAAFATRMTCYKELRLALDHVYQTICNNQCNLEQTRTNFLQDDTLNGNETNANGQIMKIVQQSLYCKDPLAHVTAYEWLLSHEMHSELLNLIEPSLGEFLRRSANRNPDNLNLIELLWKYYEKNGHHSQAAHILDNLAMKHNVNIMLDQRIECLVRAVMCMRNESVGSSAGNGVFLKELEDKMDIARVQKAVLNDMSQLSRTRNDATKAVQQLNSTLYDITQLYQIFAEPFALWECQLLIINCSHHNDPLLIESVWSNIVGKAIDGSGTAYERSTRLFTKIETLVREFGESGHCFPFEFLIRELEVKACQLRLPEGTVPEKLVAMNLDIELIMEHYFRMISMNERVWANEGNQWQLIQSAICLVSLLVNNGHTICYRSKRRVAGKAQDIIGVCLNICYQRPDTDHLQKALKELQCQLERLV